MSIIWTPPSLDKVMGNDSLQIWCLPSKVQPPVLELTLHLSNWKRLTFPYKLPFLYDLSENVMGTFSEIGSGCYH